MVSAALFNLGTVEIVDFQLSGSNSLRRVIECVAMRESTSRNHANGSTPHRLQEAMKLRNTAAVLPPPSLRGRSSCRVAAAQRDIAVGSFRGAVVNLD